MTETTQALGFQVRIQTDFETAHNRVIAALKAEGFGVLTEIDVKSTLKQKLDVDFRPYKILGACNPPLAHRALTTAPEVGLLLPCNVTVEQADDETVLVSLVDPLVMLGAAHHPDLVPVAEEAHARLERVAALLREDA
ncbi:MAG: DUF302 domain-containing protein [Anaerolineae bacterium]|nr:DUF302 domain-containing protein [Anaerolineae bacterium]